MSGHQLYTPVVRTTTQFTSYSSQGIRSFTYVHSPRR